MTDQPGGGDWASPGAAPPPPYGAPPPPPYGAPPPPGYGAPPGWGPPPYGWGPPQAPKPGVIPLRPLGIGEILDGAFTTIRRYPAATLGLAATVMLLVTVVQIVTQYSLLHGVAQHTFSNTGLETTNSDFLWRSLTAQAIVLVVTLIATVLLTGMLTAVVGQAVLGRPMGMGAAWERTRPLLPRLLGATLLVALVIFGVVLAAALPGIVILIVGAASSTDSATTLGAVLAVVGGICGAVYGFYLAVSLSLTTPALVLEKLTVRTAMRRSRQLVRSSWWRIFGILLLAQLIAGVIGAIIIIPFDIAGGIGSVFSGNTDDQFQFVPLLLTGIGGLLSATLVRPFSAGAIALLYLDRRMRAEALDLTLQQAAAAPPS
jgi:hypothetical protein